MLEVVRINVVISAKHELLKGSKRGERPKYGLEISGAGGVMMHSFILRVSSNPEEISLLVLSRANQSRLTYALILSGIG